MAKEIDGWALAGKLNIGWRMECIAAFGWAFGLIDTAAAFDADDVDWSLIEDAFSTEAEKWPWRATKRCGAKP